MKRLPAVLASRTGVLGVEVVEFEGTHQIPNRDALGYYFSLRREPDAEVGRIVVVFSGTVLAVRPSAFGLPELADREQTLVQFSLAAIGDYLDEHGLPEFTPSGVSAAQIECFSPQFQSWADREAASDTEIESYLKAHSTWSWRFNHDDFDIGMPDALRTRQGIPRIDKIVRLFEGELWTVKERHPSRIIIVPSPSFLRQTTSASQTHTPEASTTPVVFENQSMEPPTYVYVDEIRIGDMRRLENSGYDLSKLIALCEELNLCYRSQCYHAVAALTRAVMDHVPPVFGCKTFAEVANNYAGARSFKECMQRLDSAARRIGDAHLHTQIRASEVLPSRTQVNFSNEIDVLLAELIRILKPANMSPTT